MRKFVIDWADFHRQLPSNGDFQSKNKRRQLFDAFDPQGNGILFRSTVIRGLFRLYPRVGGISETKALLNLVYHAVRDSIAPIVPIGVDNMDRNQFRMLIMCLRCFLQLWEALWNTKDSDDVLVTTEDISTVLPLFAKWGLSNIDFLENRLREDFWRDTGGKKCGVLTFDTFADYCLRRTLPEMGQIDADAEKVEAVTLLRRTHPHMFFKDAPLSQGGHSIGAVTQTLGVRPRRPAPGEPRTLDGDVTRYIHSSNSERPGSVYMRDYRTSQDQGGKLSPVARPPRGGPPPEPPDGGPAALQHSRSAPSLTPTSAGKAFCPGRPRVRASAHWSQNHVDMYNTRQLHALKAAGGIVLSPKQVSFS